MSIFDWESEIEFIDYEKERVVLAFEQPHESLTFDQFSVRNSVVRYQTTKDRIVRIKVLSDVALRPTILSFITNSRGKEQIRKGELIGSHDIESRELTPEIIIKRQLPIFEEIGQSGGRLALPLPLFGFELQLPS